MRVLPDGARPEAKSRRNLRQQLKQGVQREDDESEGPPAAKLANFTWREELSSDYNNAGC